MDNQNDRIFWESIKFREEDRTFKTRLEFILSLFEDTFAPEDILGRGIQHKLNFTYEQYVEKLNRSLNTLQQNDNPLKILKEINRKEKQSG